MMQGRSAVDIVIILLATMVASVVIIATIGVTIGKLVHPDADFSGAEKAIGTILTTIISALIGFVGGRSVGKGEGPGVSRTEGRRIS